MSTPPRTKASQTERGLVPQLQAAYTPIERTAVYSLNWCLSNWAWFLIAGVWLVFVMLLYFFATRSPLGLGAFYVYFESAKALISLDTIYSGITGWIYLYPPLLAQTLMPLAALNDSALAVNLWLGFNIGLLLATMNMLAHYVPRRYTKLLWVMPVFFVPIWQAMYIGQVTIIMLALLAGVWVAVHENRPFLAGALLALASWIKVFPALLVLYFLWRRDWHVIKGVIIGGFGLLALQVIISGPNLMLAFFDVLFSLFLNGQPEATYENLSIFAFVSRLFQVNRHVVPLLVDENLFNIARIALTVGVFVIGFLAITRSQKRTTSSRHGWRFDVEFSLVIVTILLLGSTLWISGLPPLLLTSVLILRNARHYRWSRAIKVTWLLSMILIMMYQPLLIVLTRLSGAVDALVLSIGFFGVMLFWGLMVALLVSQHRPAQVMALANQEAEKVDAVARQRSMRSA
ncbi:MAG: glycosyltransferase family 87 protein [Chloroflexota bacterium]